MENIQILQVNEGIAYQIRLEQENIEMIIIRLHYKFSDKFIKTLKIDCYQLYYKI